jgi:cell shape-determining protein MreC
MSYHSDKLNKKKYKRMTLVAGFIIIIGLVQVGFFSGFSSGAHKILSPVLKAGSIFIDTANTGVLTALPKKVLVKRVQELEALVEMQNVLVEKVHILELKNLRLEEELGRVRTSSNTVAQVISKPIVYPYGTLLVDQGSQDGILKNSKVYAFDTVLLGYVVDVYEKTSLITLYSKSGEQVQGLLKDGVGITLTGRGDGSFETLVSRDMVIEEGDYISTVGFDPYVIGKVTKIQFDPREPKQKILVQGIININSLIFVEIE